MNTCYMHNQESVVENETQRSLGFYDTNGSPHLGQTTRHVIVNNNKEEENLLNSRLCRPAKERKKERYEK